MKLIRVCVGDWSVFKVFRVCINYGDGEKIRKLVRVRSLYFSSFEKIEEGIYKDIVIKMVKMWWIEERKKKRDFF